MSGMIELTTQPGQVGQFVNDLAHCYDDYVPDNVPGSIPLRFPVATIVYEQPFAKEQRQRSVQGFEQGTFLLFQQFAEEYGHCAISKDCVDDSSKVDPALFVLAHSMKTNWDEL
jgi:hypothetical protein